MGEGFVERDGGEWDGEGTGEEDAPLDRFEELRHVGVAWVVSTLRLSSAVWMVGKEDGRTPVSTIPMTLRSRASSV